MAAKSPDGRPPPRWARLLEWKWSAVAAITLLVVGVTLGLAYGVHGPEYLFGGFLVALLLGAAVPAWGAGLLRGREERAARAVAKRTTPPNQPAS